MSGHFPLAGIPLPRLIPWLNILMVALLAYTLAQLTWTLVPQSGGDLVAPIPLKVEAAPTGSVSVSLDKVAALHLFGRSDEPPPVEEKAPIVAPETRLNLTLRGVVALDSQEGAHAIIAEGGNVENAYKVGDTVPGGAVLHEIHTDRVILKRGGRFETLTLPKEKVAGGEVQTESSHAPGARPGNSSVRSSVETMKLQGIRDRLMKNPQEAMQLVNAQPVMEGGQLKGYRLNPGRDRKLFGSVGLRPGDIVTNVNGIALNDMSQMGAVLQQLSSANRLDVTVERGGQPTQLSLSLE